VAPSGARRRRAAARGERDAGEGARIEEDRRDAMPEGDTILRSARTLTARLAGKAIVRAESPLAPFVAARPPLVGRTITRVEARGKHLVVHLDDGRAIRSHLRMHGSWHVYRPGERWRMPGHLARLVLEVDGCVAVCFRAPDVELLASPAASSKLRALGPDLLADGFDPEDAAARLRASPARSIGEALMDQRIVAGIGNIYKSETLFVTRSDPFAPVAAFDDGALRAIVAAARRLLRQNLAPGQARRTRPAGAAGNARHWVYDRSGAPCFVCGGPIAMRRQGALHRSTYYCPRCQCVTKTTEGDGPATAPRAAEPEETSGPT